MKILVLTHLIFLIFLTSCSLSSTENSPGQVNPEPYRYRKVLDPGGNYLLQWQVNWESKTVIFNVTVETTGWVGLGLSRNGKMSGADIVIGGVYSNGESYFSDHYATGNQIPEIDSSQDYILIEASEKGNLTFLSFSRQLDTCDEDHDLPITNDLLSIIWAYGDDDNINYHGVETKGVYNAYLLDPDFVPPSLRTFDGDGIVLPKSTKSEDLKVFRMTRNFAVPPRDTIYWVSFHKVPTTSKQHIVGFNNVIPSPEDRPHVHHMLLNRCYAPPGVDPDVFFGDAARSNGDEVYFLGDSTNSLPTRNCREAIYSFGIGARGFFLPEHVGIPMSENGTEYFMLQVHYDNPNSTRNLNVEIHLEAYYSEKLREHDASMFWIGLLSNATTSIVIPPDSTSHVVMGHCAEKCLSKMFPEEGINLIAAMLHTHTTGSSVRTLHFRGNQELPWFAADENFDFNFQQFRIFKDEVKILPGDLLTNRCTYDTTTRNGSVVTGGFSTRQEMCSTFFYYYNRVPGYINCRSEIRTEEYLEDVLGIQNFTFSNNKMQEMIITSPSQSAGMTIGEHANANLDFSPSFREEIQWQHIYQRQVSSCENVIPDGLPGADGDDDDAFETAFPQGIQRYRNSPQCSKNSVCRYRRRIADPCMNLEEPTLGSTGCKDICTSEGNRGGRCEDRRCLCYGCPPGRSL